MFTKNTPAMLRAHINIFKVKVRNLLWTNGRFHPTSGKKTSQKYVMVRHRQGQVLIEESLKVLETELGARAVRVHRNALAMAAQVAGLEKTADGGCALIFHDIPDRLEVSRRHLPAIRQFLRDA